VDRPRAATAFTKGCRIAGGGAAYMEYGNGIVGDMCIHMFDANSLAAGTGLAGAREFGPGASLVRKAGGSNISDTQIATFEYDKLNVVWTHRTWGHAPDPEVSLVAHAPR